MVLDAVNYELQSRGGYRRIDGIERFDGRSSPTEASYWVLNFTSGTAAIVEGDTVDGATSGASGEALIDAVVTSGSYSTNDASGYLVLTSVTGTFTTGEALQVSGSTKSAASGTATERGASDTADDAAWAQDAIETQRAKIGKVGASDGSGKIRGVNIYNGDVYAFRDNAAGTQCLMWKATSSGWVQQDLGNRINFTVGTSEFQEGETLTGGTSLATATIKRVIVKTGDWSTNDAAGYLIIGTVTGGPFQAETGTSASGSATLSGAETANKLNPGGRFEFVNHNFYANASRFCMYGVDGVSQGFEWDGSVFVPIDTGNTVDTPVHVEAHKSHLFYTFAGGSLQYSDAGLPYIWASGGEIGVGDEITGIKREIGGVLAVLSRNRTQALYGDPSTSPELKTVFEESGAIEWTIQRIGATRYLDDRGLTQMASVQAFGDFKSSVFSQAIEPLINAKKSNVISSVIVKSKNQYRLFFNDGTAIVATFDGNKLVGFTTMRYKNPADGSALPVDVVAQGEDSSGNEVLYFGSDTGYLYQMDKGTSMDGAAVDATLILAYNHLGSPSYNKQFKKITLEADGSSGTTIQYNALYDYSSGNSPADITLSQTLTSGGGYWDTSVWDAFTWANEDVSQIEGNPSGIGRNMALQIFSSGTYVEPHTLYGATYHYLMRRLVR